MSLDVYLHDCERTVQCPDCGKEFVLQSGGDMVYEANITHNLVGMATAAGLYEACWHPDRIHAQKAGELIPHLQSGLDRLRADPKIYQCYNSPNGWGHYDDLVHFVERYLAACQRYPHATITTG